MLSSINSFLINPGLQPVVEGCHRYLGRSSHFHTDRHAIEVCLLGHVRSVPLSLSPGILPPPHLPACVLSCLTTSPNVWPTSWTSYKSKRRSSLWVSPSRSPATRRNWMRYEAEMVSWKGTPLATCSCGGSGDGGFCI